MERYRLQVAHWSEAGNFQEDVSGSRPRIAELLSSIQVEPGRSTTDDLDVPLPGQDGENTAHNFISLVRMVIQEPLKQYENYLRNQKGIELRYTGLQGRPSTAYEFVYSVLLSILMFFPAFVAGSMTIGSLTEEMENNTLQTLLSAPLTVNGMIGAKITSV